ncbi:MAG: LytTR family DNA-binding domain-containing protein [Bacteroidota bacterium]
MFHEISLGHSNIIFWDFSFFASEFFTIQDLFESQDLTTVLLFEDSLPPTSDNDVFAVLRKPLMEKEVYHLLLKLFDRAYSPPKLLSETIHIEAYPQKIIIPKIPLSTQDSIRFVSPEEIILCRASNNYTQIFLTNSEKKLISKPLKEFDHKLRQFDFFRTHQSFLVNLNHIVEYFRKECYLVMTDNIRADVTRQKKEALLGRLISMKH